MPRSNVNNVDERVSRIVLSLLGVCSLAVATLSAFYALGGVTLTTIPLLITVVFVSLGLILLAVSIFGSKAQAIKWAENTGNHEVLFLVVLLAYGLASLTKSKNT